MLLKGYGFGSLAHALEEHFKVYLCLVVGTETSGHYFGSSRAGLAPKGRGDYLGVVADVKPQGFRYFADTAVYYKSALVEDYDV